MSSPFVAEIRIFPFNFAPTGWAFCNGQLMPISQNTALFALLGTTYGGDGKSTFALPNLTTGLVALAAGAGSGLTQHFLGEESGSETTTLLQSEIPAHIHVPQASAGFGSSNDAAGRVFARPFGGGSLYKLAGGPVVTLAPETITPTGGDLPHNNSMPYLRINYCIAMQGVFPPRP